jgi:hypothetical protein
LIIIGSPVAGLRPWRALVAGLMSGGGGRNLGPYPDAATYTAQLRALEAYHKASPGSAEASFVLAYHYGRRGDSSKQE